MSKKTGFADALHQSFTLAFRTAPQLWLMLLCYFTFYMVLYTSAQKALSFITLSSYFVDTFFFTFCLLYMHHLRTKRYPPELSKNFIISLKKLPALLLAIIFFSIIIMLGFLLIIPGVYFYGMMFLYLAVIILTEKSPVHALKKAVRLVWGHWWWMVSLYLIPGFIFLFQAIILLLNPASELTQFLPTLYLPDIGFMRPVLLAFLQTTSLFFSVVVTVIVFEALTDY